MVMPCKANCENQKKGQCQSNDERVQIDRVEFGEDWDPLENCQCFSPEDQSCKKQNRQNNK